MLNCGEIDKELVDKMFGLIKKSVEQNKERYVLLWRKKDRNIIPSNIIVGSRHRITGKHGVIKFPEDVEEFVADFHTHTSSSTRASTDDIVSSAARKIPFFCIGGKKGTVTEIIQRSRYLEDEIICYGIKDNGLLKLGDEAYTLAMKGEIEKARSKILQQMYDRVKKVGYDNILDVKCTFRR